MSFGNKLKLLRVRARLDQESISKALLISQPVYSRYENDEKNVTAENAVVQRAAGYFNVTVKWLLSPIGNLLAEDESTMAEEQNFYRVPKDFMQALMRQQDIAEKLLQMLTEKNSGSQQTPS